MASDEHYEQHQSDDMDDMELIDMELVDRTNEQEDLSEEMRAWSEALHVPLPESTVSPHDAIPSFVSYKEWKDAHANAHSLTPTMTHSHTTHPTRLPPGPDDLKKTLDSWQNKLIAQSALSSSSSSSATATNDSVVDMSAPPAKQRDRFNFASFDCGAIVLASNPGAVKTSAVLSENRDTYMINRCATSGKYIILQLCDEILIDTIVLANFEFFSSIFKDVRFSVSDQYPPKNGQWLSIGSFVAKNSREVQVFPVENTAIWARFLRVDFLTHHGSEYYCPVSLVRVNGKTMMEDLRKDADEPEKKVRHEPPPPAPVHSSLEIPISEEAEKEPVELFPPPDHPSTTTEDPITSRTDETPSSPSVAAPKCEPPPVNAKPPVVNEPPDQPIPNSRESVFKTIMKRLSYLEQNLTLYQQYLEEQSHQFREIFTSLEVYQRKRLNSFLDLMNRTLYAQYESLRLDYLIQLQDVLFDMTLKYEHVEASFEKLSKRGNTIVSEVNVMQRWLVIQWLLTVLIVFYGAMIREAIRTKCVRVHRYLKGLVGRFFIADLTRATSPQQRTHSKSDRPMHFTELKVDSKHSLILPAAQTQTIPPLNNRKTQRRHSQPNLSTQSK